MSSKYILLDLLKFKEGEINFRNVKVFYGLIAAGAVGVTGPLYLGHRM